MAAGNIKVTSKHCKKCNERTKFERNSLVWGAGDLIMVLLTAGLYLPFRFLIHALTNPWRCTKCGSR
ncbi:Uncharacterised protein [BD1-7 clade bacterium]|uniref:LITAF domain-containing protein n=1 Tax=BD1-7 clade bacterium TaxID=2029982 RepID=A0A5S9QR11_9GAMM|nr:Uncharacterised protein [BD1-7 clade bacterium]